MKLAYNVSDREQWISAGGALLAVVAVLAIGRAVNAGGGVLPITASMGASIVLLFAVPHGAMSQPWPLVGGHVISAIIGVTCARWLHNDPMIAAALAVALALVTMYSLRCLHPPGGATALYAVLGGPSVHALGYGYVFSPVLLDVSVLLAVAVLFNYPLMWRRYPQVWCERSDRVSKTAEEKMIPHSNLVYALSQINTFVDVSEEDLQKIYALAVSEPHSAQTVSASLKRAESRI